MLFKNAPEKFWNLIASKYAASDISDRAAYDAKIEKLKTYLSQEMSVLDIGCATGTQCGDISGNVRQVTGIDISDKLLVIAEKRMSERGINNVDFLQTSVFDKRFQAGDFDVVMAFFVLHFFDDIDAVFKQVHDLLKPGGLFISETACLGDKNRVMRGILKFLGQLGFIPQINQLTTRQLEQSLEKAGFNIIEKTRFSKASDAEYTLIARKSPD